MAAARLVASVEAVLLIANVPVVALEQPADPLVPGVGVAQLKPVGLPPVVEMVMSSPGVLAVTVVVTPPVAPSLVALTPAAVGHALNARARLMASFLFWLPLL